MKIKVSYHTMDGNSFTSTKPLAFVLDALKDDDPAQESGKKNKKKGKEGIQEYGNTQKLWCGALDGQNQGHEQIPYRLADEVSLLISANQIKTD